MTNGMDRQIVKRFRFLVTLLLVALLSAGTGSALPRTATAQGTPVASEEAGQFTPVLQEVLATPRWFTGADGRVHLVYELMLTNALSLPATVTAVDVLDAGDGRPVATLVGASLVNAMSLLSAANEPTTTLPPGNVGVVWFDISLDNPEEIPASIEHRITVTLPPGLPVPLTVKSIAGAAEVDLQPPRVLGAPVSGPGWVALGSCCDGPHRRAVQPFNNQIYLTQRYAIDFNVLDAEGRLASSDGTLEGDPSFGQPILAVADATVVEAVDQYPDQDPNNPTPVTGDEVNGNHVLLDLGDGAYAFYAHLRSGSVDVQAGDTVTQAQVIGELGNSGNSTGAHLHFQVVDSPSIVADGLPYVFDQFELTGQTPPIDVVIDLALQGEPIPLETVGAGPRSDALPLGRDVVTFAPEPAG